MSDGYDSVVVGLETRYDYHSARVVAKEALALSGLKSAAAYKPGELQQLVDAVGTVGDNLAAVWTALGVSPSGAPAPVAPAAPVVEAAPAETAPAAEAEAEAEAAPEAKEAAPAAKKETKKAASKGKAKPKKK